MAFQGSGGKGKGNVIGPGLGSNDGDIAIFDGPTGKLLKDTNNLIYHLNIAYGNLTLTPVPHPSACVAALAGLGPGNVDNGNHIYAVTFVTAIGETELGTASNIVTTVAGDGQVILTGIPTASVELGVTQRNIYRTKAGGSSFYFLATIPDNLTVTYPDNTADGGLGVDDATYRSNDTQWIYVDGTKSGIITNHNTCLGINSGISITTGSSLTFFGVGAGLNNTTGDNNTFLGAISGYFNTTGLDNTFLGYNSGSANISGMDNTFVGSDSGNSNITGNYNTFLGSGAGDKNTTGANNTFLGYNSGFSNIGGIDNTFVGYQSGNANTTGANNTFLGYNSGFSNIGGIDNTFIGSNSGFSNTNGVVNTFVGFQSGQNNTTGVTNTFLGANSGAVNIGGNDNTFVGYQSGHSNTTGLENTFVGRDSGITITTGTGCVCIGYIADTGSNALVNSIAIGSGAIISNNNSWVIGILGTKQNIFEGANAAMGTSNLGAGGTILVNNTLVTANSRIFLTTQVPGGVVGGVYISARVAATSFTIQSTNVADTSTVAWEIKEPA
jgi:hypothetical protein